MRIKLIISDDDYRRILATPKRVRGTICQNSPEEFCFRAYSESNEAEQLPKRQFKTKHSTTTVNSKRIRLYMSIPREETTDPAEFRGTELGINSLTPSPSPKGRGVITISQTASPASPPAPPQRGGE